MDDQILQSLSAPDLDAYRFFGVLVKGIGDANGDGTSDVAVRAADVEKETGRVYVISGANGSVVWSLGGLQLPQADTFPRPSQQSGTSTAKALRTLRWTPLSSPLGRSTWTGECISLAGRTATSFEPLRSQKK